MQILQKHDFLLEVSPEDGFSDEILFVDAFDRK